MEPKTGADMNSRRVVWYNNKVNPDKSYFYSHNESETQHYNLVPSSRNITADEGIHNITDTGFSYKVGYDRTGYWTAVKYK